jgi:hypothetical protein
MSLVSESLDKRNARNYRKNEIRDHDEDYKKRKSGWKDGEQMGSTWSAVLDRFLIRRFTRARRRGRVFSTDTLQESMTKTSVQVWVAYYTSDSSRNCQEPKETKWTSVSAMSGSSKSGTENDEQGGAHKGNLAAHSVTN